MIGWTKPLVSESLACHPEDITAMEKLDKDKGLSAIHYDSDGRPSFSSQRQKKEYLKAHGYCERNCFY